MTKIKNAFSNFKFDKDYDALDPIEKIEIDISADLTIEALEQAGLVVVPKEPTKDMCAHGQYANVGPISTRPYYVYQAMIEAVSTDTPTIKDKSVGQHLEDLGSRSLDTINKQY